MSFNKLGLSPWLLKLCEKIQYVSPTPIQALTIPQILKGESVIANAQTGSGKTAAFAFPLLHKLAKDPYSIFGLIIAPSRQLAVQIHQQFSIFGQSMNLRMSLLVGGVNYNSQIPSLQNYPHIVVGTPGRICQMINKCEKFKENLERVQVLVLDQADRLFEQTLLPSMRTIVKNLPSLNQAILATATIDQNFQGKRLKQLLDIKIDFVKYSTYEERKTVKTLIQKYILTPQQLKSGYLLHYLQKNPTSKTIVFVKTCKQCTLICQTLKEFNFKAVYLHSFMKNNLRSANLGIFRSDKANILVTTDLTSRGLDINNVNLVINYNLPRAVSDYIHRVGRTARNGLEGQAVSFVTQYQVNLFLEIQKQIGVKIDQDKIPEQLEYVSKFNRIKRQVKVKLMSSGILDDLEKRRKNKLEFKNQMKRQKYNSQIAN